MTPQDKIIAQLRAIGKNDALAIIRQWAVSRHRTEQEHVATLIEAGFELVKVAPGSMSVGAGPLTRPLVWVGKNAYALRPDVFLEQRKSAMAETEEGGTAQQSARGPSAGESMASVLCPLCKSEMAKEPICPSCAKGRMGFKILCTCTGCGHEVSL